MDSTKYTTYGIDVADIWHYERECYFRDRSTNPDKTAINELYELLQPFYLQGKHKPFIEASDESAYAQRYLRQYQNRDNEEVCLDFFFCRGNGYDMEESCEITLKDNNLLSFQNLFVLKLRQYCDGLIHLSRFLKYQLKVNFKSNPEHFRKFIDLSLLQFPNKIDVAIIKVIDDWFSEIAKKKSANALRPKTKGSGEQKKEGPLKTEVESTTTNAEQETTTTVAVTEKPQDTVLIEETGESGEEEVLPEGYTPIPGKFTKEEIQHFFSFLYKEKSKEGACFLSEEDVREIFKYGLAIPPAPLSQKYKLNCSLKFPKGIVEFCIYGFFRNHTSPHNKKDILKFFASYIMDFERALINEHTLQIWSDNVTGKRPEKMTFAIKDYLPERMR